MSIYIAADTSNDGLGTMDIIVYSIVGGLLLCLLLLCCGWFGYRGYKRITFLLSSDAKAKHNAIQSMSKPTATSIDISTINSIGKSDITNNNSRVHTPQPQNQESDNSDNDVIDGMKVTAGGRNDAYVEKNSNIDDGNEEKEEREQSVHDSYYERTHHLYHSSSTDLDLEFGGQTFEI